MQKVSRRAPVGCSVNDVLLEPWFLDRRRAAAIRRIVPDHFAQKMRFYFEDWGCMVCRSTKRRYGSNGMCHICVLRIHRRLITSLRRHWVEKPPSLPTRLMDEVARVRSAKALLSDFADHGWSPSALRLSSSVRQTRSKGAPGFVR